MWTGKFLVSSKLVKAYLKSHGIKSYSSRTKEVEYYKTIKNREFYDKAMELKKRLSEVDTPYKIGFHFVRESRHKFDFGNAVEILSDLFTAFDVWEDDNMDVFHPSVFYINDKGYSYNKLNPGVYIKIINEPLIKE